MPSRMLRDWTDSIRFDGLSADAERLFVRLIMKADDYGRFHSDPRLIKATCFPLIDNLRPNDLTRWLDELSTRQLILRYEADGRGILAIVNYGQRLKQSRAKFPPLPGESVDWLPTSDIFRESPGSSGKFREVGILREEKGREEKRREENGREREIHREREAFRRPTLDQAIAAAANIGITKAVAEEWWHAREASEWVKGLAGGGSTPVGNNWQSDLKTYSTRSGPISRGQNRPKRHYDGGAQGDLIPS